MRKAVTRSRRQYVLQSPALEIARELPGVRGAPFPGFIDFALASLVPKPPKNPRWVCEIKFDGYRFQMHSGTPAQKCSRAEALTGHRTRKLSSPPRTN